MPKAGQPITCQSGSALADRDRVIAVCALDEAGRMNPSWGAFTFPISAFAGVQIFAVKACYGWAAEVMAIG